MSDRNEVIVTSDGSGLLWTACIWDSHTGTALMNYKGGGTTNSHCMSFVGNDYLLCAEKARPIIHVWPLNSQETSKSTERIVTPGCVSVLAVSPNSDYCVIAIAEKLYIWDLAGGQLLSTTTRHYRAVSCIKFTDDGSHFVSGGQDGLVIVWPLAYLVSYHASELLQQVEAGQPEPKHVFSDHSLPVMDLYVGNMGIQSLIASVSGDHTCKIYSLADANLLLTLIFNCAVSAVTMNVNELEVFVGAVSGEIYHFYMTDIPRTADYHMTEEKSLKFIGHSKTITSLSVSLDGLRLLSGSSDEKVVIWDIRSRQCMKVLQHKGPVSNAFFAICPKHVFSSVFKPFDIVQNFRKGAGNTKGKIRFIKKCESADEQDTSSATISQSLELPQEETEHQVALLKQINRDLYTFSVKKLLGRIHGASNSI